MAAAPCSAMCSTTGRFELARACQADCEGLARLAERVLPWGAGPSTFTTELRRRDARVWRVCREGRVCAGVVAREAGREVELLWLVVEPGARRHSLQAPRDVRARQRRVHRHALRHCHAAGYKLAVTGTARKMYMNFGLPH